MDVTGVVSILWVIGSISACILGCHRSRVLGRKIRTLEEKLESQRTSAPVYTLPLYTPPIPSAPSYDPRSPV